MIVRVVDFETTGFPPKAGVCEVGWTDVTVTEDSVTIGETFEELCNPGLPIGEDAMRVHGITEEMVASKPPSALIFRRVMEGADVFCAHNCEFERNFFTGGEKGWICTYKIALVLFPDLPSHRNGTIPEHLLVPLDADRCAPLHRAGPDTYVTAAILRRFLAEAPGADNLARLRDFIEVTRQPKRITRMPSGGNGKHKGQPLADLPHSYLVWGAEDYPVPDIRRALKAELERRRAAK